MEEGTQEKYCRGVQFEGSNCGVVQASLGFDQCDSTLLFFLLHSRLRECTCRTQVIRVWKVRGD